MKMFQTIFYLLVITYGVTCILHDVNLIDFSIESYIPSTYVIIFVGAICSYSALFKNES